MTDKIKNYVALSKNNYVFIILGIIFLFFGVLGGWFNQKWAENLYVGWGLGISFIFVFFAVSSVPLKPIRGYAILFTFNILLSVALGWWFVAFLYLVTIICFGRGIFLWDKKRKSQDDITDH
jgi:hypothetical protein